MARLTVEQLAAVCVSLALSGCFNTTRVASVDRALRIVAPVTASNDAQPVGSLPAAAELALTRGDAVARALARDAAIASLRAAAAADHSRVAAADDLDNPELRFTSVDFDHGTNDSELALRARPPRPGALTAREQIARARSERSASDAKRAEQLFANRVDRLFCEAQLYERADELSRAAADLEKRRVELAAHEREHGMVTRVGAADLAMTLDGERRRAAQRARRFSEARVDLLEVLGLSPAANVRLVGEPLDLSEIETFGTTDADAVERALRQRPEVGAAGAEIDRATATEWLERSEQWPWFSFVQLGYDFQPNGLQAWNAGVAVDVPVFSLNRDAIRASEADALSTRRAFEATVREIANDVKQSLERARDAAEEVRRFRDGPAMAAADARDATAAARTAGHATERDLLLAEEQWLDARRTELELLDDYIAARSRLLTDLGTEK
jgi:outer membrane protein TolC